MSQYNQQAQVYVQQQYQGGSPNYQTQPPPGTAIYTRVHNNMQIPSNPGYDIYPQQQQYIPQDAYMAQPTQPYYIPSPAPGNALRGHPEDHRVPGSGSSNTPSTNSEHMGMDPSPAALLQYGMTTPMQLDKQLMNNNIPRLVINEQPKSAFRFRYNCEGSSHGALLGSKSEKGRKSYPSVYIENYFGHAVVVASLVPSKTDEPHPFSLTGRGVHNGLYLTEIRDGTKQGTEVRLKDLSILHVKKQEVTTALLHKHAVESFIKQHGIYSYIKSSDWHSKNSNTGDDEHDESQKSFGATLLVRMRNDEKKALKERAQKACEQQQLTTVRLCFRAYLFDQQGQLVQEIGPTFSCAITDTKNCPSLKICKIDRCVGSVAGNDTIYLLCDKVSRDDIDVIFEEERDGQVVWTANGDFQPSEVHHQVAIVFTTPPYKGPSNTESIQCCIKLRKPSTNEESGGVTFTYLPDEMTKAYIGNKRKRIIPDAPYLPNKPQPAGMHFNNQANFDPAVQLVAASTLSLDELSMGNLSDPNIQTSLLIPDNLSSFPDMFSLHTLSSEVGDLIGVGQDMSEYQEKDTPISLLSGGDTRLYTQGMERDGVKRGDVVERDGPKLQKETGDKSPDLKEDTFQTQSKQTTEEEGEEKKVREKTGRNPLHIARDMGHCTQRMMNRQYQAVQKYAYTGDVRNLLQPLLPYFYLHEHTRSDTLLHTALISQQMSALTDMLSLLRVHKQHAKVVVNMSNSYRHTPLHLAVSLNHVTAVRELLDAGADPFKFDIYGNTSFHIAASRGHASCLSLLIDYITKFNRSERAEAYELCADVYNFDGKTPLHLSIEHENWAQCCDLLLKGGADLNAQEQLEGTTLLHYAVHRDSLPLACYLLSDHGKEIDVDATNHSGDTPLYVALMNNRLNIASTLVRSGASVDIPNADGQTAETKCSQTPALHGFIQECRSARDKPVYASDLYRLREEHVSDLAKLLDEGKWKDLAVQLKIDSNQFVNSKEKSTKLLLRAYEVNGGTVSGLIQACEKIGCPEGANILKKLIM